jgi:hypothetical protein
MQMTMEYKITKDIGQFEPFSMVYHNDYNGKIYLKTYISNDVEENIPAIIQMSHRRSLGTAHNGNNNRVKVIEKFTLMRENYKLLEICGINQVKELNIIHNYTNEDNNILDIVVQISNHYSIIVVENNQPVRIIDNSLEFSYGVSYFIIKKSEEKKWFNAIRQKPHFPLLCFETFSNQNTIPKWSPKNHIFYPTFFREIVYTLMPGIFSKSESNESKLKLLNHDIFVNIIEKLVESEYMCPYYHIYLEKPGKSNVINWGKTQSFFS